MNGNEYPARFSPDGLTEQLIDVLLREVDVAAVVTPRSTSVLVDGQAAQRRYRREARRCASAVVRALPVRGVAGRSYRAGAPAGADPGPQRRASRGVLPVRTPPRVTQIAVHDTRPGRRCLPGRGS